MPLVPIVETRNSSCVPYPEVTAGVSRQGHRLNRVLRRSLRQFLLAQPVRTGLAFQAEQGVLGPYPDPSLAVPHQWARLQNRFGRILDPFQNATILAQPHQPETAER